VFLHVRGMYVLTSQSQHGLRCSNVGTEYLSALFVAGRIGI
jgi:hypothetical protein